MSQKTSKAIRRSAFKYAREEEQRIANYQQEQIYSLTFPKRLVYCLGVLFKWGKTAPGRSKADGRVRMTE